MKTKFIFYSLLAVTLSCFIAFCSNTAPDVAPARAKIYDSDPDTLVAASSVATAVFDLGPFNSRTDYSLQINADSLSGATGATCLLRLSLDGGGSDWVTLQTVVIDGVSTRNLTSGSFERGKLECRCTTPSSTQSTAVRVDFATSD